MSNIIEYDQARQNTRPAGKAFIQIDQAALSAPISAPAFKVYCGLKTYARSNNMCWPGLDQLALLVKVQKRQIRRLVAELEQAGLIKIETRPGTSNLYTLLNLENQDDFNKGGHDIYDRGGMTSMTHEVHALKYMHEVHAAAAAKSVSSKPNTLNSEPKTETLPLVPPVPLPQSPLSEITLDLLEAGFDQATAINLTDIALANERDTGYVASLIAESHTSRIKDPLAWVSWMITGNRTLRSRATSPAAPGANYVKRKLATLVVEPVEPVEQIDQAEQVEQVEQIDQAEPVEPVIKPRRIWARNWDIPQQKWIEGWQEVE